MVDTKQVEKLKILLASDWHESVTNMEKLIAKEDKDYDFVLISGDQANCNNQIGQPVNEEENLKASNSNELLVLDLQACAKQGGQVIYIPGNHDAEVLFRPEEAPKIGDSENIHNLTFELADGLVIAGLGGSLPTLCREEGETEFRPVFNPYPYENEQAMAKALVDFWEKKV